MYPLEDLESQVVRARLHLTRAQERKRRRLKGGSQMGFTSLLKGILVHRLQGQSTLQPTISPLFKRHMRKLHKPSRAHPPPGHSMKAVTCPRRTSQQESPQGKAKSQQGKAESQQGKAPRASVTQRALPLTTGHTVPSQPFQSPTLISPHRPPLLAWDQVSQPNTHPWPSPTYPSKLSPMTLENTDNDEELENDNEYGLGPSQVTKRRKGAPNTSPEAGPPHAIIIPELEKDAADLTLWTLKGVHAIQKFVTDLNRPEPKGVTIPAKIRQMACSIQQFLPEAALTSRDVSRAFLTTSHGNLLCPLHAKFAKKRTVFEAGARGYWVTGMDPSGPSVNRTKRQAKPRVEGFCHCGCKEDAVLFEFAMWKRWEVLAFPSDTVESQTESLRGQVMDPRMRMFVKAAYERDTGLVLEDWWAGRLTQAEAARARLEKVREHCTMKLAMLSPELEVEINVVHVTCCRTYLTQ
ncbi:hypothetical protein JB92DRAFT_2827328 [Gautieria morchelliformis]|nr:hypothetical protein JB92DRAFT_2827328 [Gautieria morchelliformis]